MWCVFIERYVKKALVEILSVVLDLRKWESQPKKLRGDKPDIGMSSE